MKLAVCLYKYFPFGGLARDFLRIMTRCYEHGYEVDVYTMEWHGERPKGFNINVLPKRGWTNHSKVANFIKTVTPILKRGQYELVIGFNKMPGLDIYYAADPCYLDRMSQYKSFTLQRFGRRFKFYAGCEGALFGADSKTVSLMISDVQQALFKQLYDTPDEHLIMLPPGIDLDRKRPANWQKKRRLFRHQHQLQDADFMLLMVGTSFKTKGLDRSIVAIASLPESIKHKTKLFVVGEGNARPYIKLAKQHGIEKKILFFGGRKDVPDFLLGADVLLHPARKENTGTAILEAIVAGLPVITTQVCGYAKHVINSQAGMVLNTPFKQIQFNQQLKTMLNTNKLRQWSENALDYAENEDLYSMPDKAATIIMNMAKG